MIAVFTAHTELLPKAMALAKELQLPFQEHADYLLLLTPDYLGLQKTREKSLPLYIDFSSKRMNYRRENMNMRKEILIRAMGLKSHSKPRIIDATAGLARDSFLLASLGFNVQLIERSPIIHALVRDGIERGLQNPTLAPIVKRMDLIQSDAVSWLKQLTEKPDIIYLDPMFPERKKTALSKLDMRIFHDVVGDDLDADLLLQTALTCAIKRVVVKRPRLAKELSGITPTYSLSGSSSRFDIYIT
jgi:16S rRNA (guanine1516-N2)-methyltransferase